MIRFDAGGTRPWRRIAVTAAIAVTATVVSTAARGLMPTVQAGAPAKTCRAFLTGFLQSGPVPSFNVTDNANGPSLSLQGSPGTALGSWVSPNGLQVYVLNLGTTPYEIDAFAAGNGAYLGNLPFGGGLGFSPDSSKVYVSNGSNVTAYSTSGLAQIWTQPLAAGGLGGSLVVSKDGSKIYVTAGTEVKQIAASGSEASSTLVSGLTAAGKAVIAPNGNTLYVGDSGGTIQAVDLTSSPATLTTHAALVSAITSFAITTDGSKLIVVKAYDTIKVFNTSDFSLNATWDVKSPAAVAVVDSTTAVVTNYGAFNYLSVYNITDGSHVEKDGTNGEPTAAGFGVSAGCSTPGPTFTSVSPTLGPSAGSTSITVNGTGFDTVGTVTVTVGGNACTSISVTDSTKLTCTTAAHAGGTVDVVVTNPDNQAATGSAAFTFVPPPAISSVSPTEGPTSGSTSITVNGTGFATSGTVTVTVGGNACTSISVTDSTKLTCTTAAHAGGATNIVVTNPDTQTGTGTGIFTFVPPPTYVSVDPTGGALAGGTSITVNGTGFATSGTVTVTVGGNACTSVSVTSSSKLTCTTAAHDAGATDVVVTNPDTQTVTGSGAYTFSAAPTFGTVSPVKGTTLGGARITVTGTGFATSGTVGVKVGGSTCTSVSIASSGSLTCTTPPHAAGFADVVITNPDAQTATGTSAYKFVAPLAGPTSCSWSLSPSTYDTYGDVTTLRVAGVKLTFKNQDPEQTYLFFYRVGTGAWQGGDPNEFTSVSTSVLASTANAWLTAGLSGIPVNNRRYSLTYVIATGSASGAPTGTLCSSTAHVTYHTRLLNMFFGNRSNGVRLLQQLLRKAGYRITVDGWFGPQTRLIVRAFQRNRKLSVTGVADEATWAALNPPT